MEKSYGSGSNERAKMEQITMHVYTDGNKTLNKKKRSEKCCLNITGVHHYNFFFFFLPFSFSTFFHLAATVRVYMCNYTKCYKVVKWMLNGLPVPCTPTRSYLLLFVVVVEMERISSRSRVVFISVFVYVLCVCLFSLYAASRDLCDVAWINEYVYGRMLRN